MKLSEMTASQGLTVISRILDPIAVLAMDQKAMRSILIMQNKGSTDNVLFQMKRGIDAGLDEAIENHKTEIITILSAINGKTYDEYDKNTGFMDLVRDIIDMYNDETIRSLFPSAQTSDKDESSGAAQEATTD